MDGFIRKPTKQRRLICEEVEARMNLPAISLEKDFWVCWILRELFRVPAWSGNLTFKGGTSLSKCWGLISRFSEDIDIVIDKGFLGFSGPESPEKAPSNKKRRQRLENLRSASQYRIHKELAPELTRRIGDSLLASDKWELAPALKDEYPDEQTLLFRYPSALDSGESYIRREVKIELGARSDSEPIQEETIHPYVFDEFPDVIGPSNFKVRALAPERTFWEKAMLLHEENYRPHDKPRKPRMARHYYDLWSLIGNGIGDRAITKKEIFERTAIHRKAYFRWSWMDYDTLVKGRLQVLPAPELIDIWRKDYNDMQKVMFFETVPTFDEILEAVGDFQDKFNGS